MKTQSQPSDLFARASACYWRWRCQREYGPCAPARAMSQVIPNHSHHGPRVILKNAAGILAVYDYDGAKDRLIRRLTRH